MKQIVRMISVSMLLLMCSVVMMAKSADDIVVVASVVNGTITASVNGQTCTLTVTPAADYYIRKSDITVKKTVDPSKLSARAFESQDVTVPVAANLMLEGPDGPVQVATDYTFTVPVGYGAYVTATFTACTKPTLGVSLEGWKYGDAPKTPTVSGNDGEAEVTYTYAAKGSSNFTATVPTEVGEYTVKASVPAIGIYTAAEATADFAITAYAVIQFTAGQQWMGYCNSTSDDLSLPEGVEAYVITAIGSAAATAEAVGYLPKDVPVLLYREETAAAANFPMKKYTGSATAPTTNLLKVDAADKVVGNAEIYVLYKNEFVLASAGTLPAGRVYLEASSMGAGGLEQGDDVNDDARLAIVIGDPTAITTVKGANEESVWYDLQGHRISGKPAVRGIYIHNGKKVVVYE